MDVLRDSACLKVTVTVFVLTFVLYISPDMPNRLVETRRRARFGSLSLDSNKKLV